MERTIKVNKRIIVVLIAGVISSAGVVQAKDALTKLIEHVPIEQNIHPVYWNLIQFQHQGRQA
jgi:hypothetical protein